MVCAAQSCLPSKALHPGPTQSPLRNTLPAPGEWHPPPRRDPDKPGLGIADGAHRRPFSPLSPLINITNQPLLGPAGLRSPLSTASQEAPTSQNLPQPGSQACPGPSPSSRPSRERPPREKVPEHSERAHGLWGQTDWNQFLNTYPVTLAKTRHLSEPPINQR